MSSSRSIKGPRGPSRGGIAKRTSTPRIDKDGDLDMGSSTGAGRGRGARGRSGRTSVTPQPSNGPQPSRRTTRNGVAPERLQQALLNGDKLQARITQSRRAEGLRDLKVFGLKDSKAVSNPDGGLRSLLQWLERKASVHGDSVKITKSRNQRDYVLISVRSDLEDRFLHLDGFDFAGTKIRIEAAPEGEAAMKDAMPNGVDSPTAIDMKAQLTNILKKRYDPNIKVLNLSALGQDADLQQMGILDLEVSTVKKFFLALMKMADAMFETSSKKEDMVAGVMLSGNNLEDLELVTTLAATFPDLKNLDLSNNNFKTVDSLRRWQWKFRKLQHIIISGNPVDQQPETRQTLLKWYPKLSHINVDQVRSQDEVDKKINPIPVQPPSFRDESDIAAKFLTAFFPMFDDNRESAVESFYDNQSNYSLSVNTSAPRLETAETPSWDAYIKKSRNFRKITHLGARTSRLITGVEAIKQEWRQLPKTRHPSLAAEGDKWLVECHPLPGLPDPTNAVPGGVGGLIITTHSHWDEIDVSRNATKQSISFDRTFVLGPGGSAGIRVISDMISLRAFGGSEAWKLQTDSHPQPPVQAVGAPPPHPEAPPGFGQAAPGKSEAQVNQEAMILEISFKTKLKLELSKQCLEMNAWDMAKAVANFEELKASGQIPPDSYL